MAKSIELSQGERTWVDDEDYEALQQHKWTLQRVRGQKYAVRGDGKSIERFTLSNDSGLRVQLSNLGCCVLSVEAPDRDGETTNVNLCYPSAEDYLTNTSYFGAFVGVHGSERFVLFLQRIDALFIERVISAFKLIKFMVKSPILNLHRG